MGAILAGIGLLFLGLNMMSDSLAPLGQYQGFRDLIVSFGQEPLLGILAGVAITAIIQSSSASVAILQALAMQGLVPLSSAIFVLFGQNIGTCVTALLASIGTNKTARRAAMIHLLFNVLGTGIFVSVVLVTRSLGFPILTDFVTSVASDPAVQIAITHLIFNVVTTAVLFPLGNILVTIACKLIPGEDVQTNEMKLLYINDKLLATPPFAITQVMKEVERMAQLAKSNLESAFAALQTKNPEFVADVYSREKLINFLNHSITGFLVKMSTLDLDDKDVGLVASLYHVINDIERIGDHAENIVEEAQVCINQNLSLHSQTLQELASVYNDTLTVFDKSFEIFSTRRSEQPKIDAMNAVEDRVDNAMVVFQEKNIDRLNKHDYPAVEGLIMIKIVTNLERVADHCTNIAYSVIKQ